MNVAEIVRRRPWRASGARALAGEALYAPAPISAPAARSARMAPHRSRATAPAASSTSDSASGERTRATATFTPPIRASSNCPSWPTTVPSSSRTS
jgi:hypothetical protein